jgi:hypothetical protein
MNNRKKNSPTGIKTIRSGNGVAATDWIGQKLRAAYQETVDEPLPADLQELLDQLDNTSAEGDEHAQ